MAEENKTTAVAPTQEKQFKTQLAIATENYMGMIQKQMMEGGAEFDEYSGKCVLAAMGAINNMIHAKNLTFNDLNGSNLNEILIKIATLKLNANAVPRECYFQIRNVKIPSKKVVDPATNKPVTIPETWEKQIEMGIEGDGNDAILARYGRDVAKVHQVWMVREGDRFTYPSFNGLQMTAPTWQPTGQGEVIRVVYPIVKVDGTVEYYIGERRDVIKNLFAHINNNLMNETFGIAEDRYKATDKQKKEIDAKKKELMDLAKKLNDLDKILDNEKLQPYISPAWTEPQSREQMIIRKMRNNVAKKIPKDFGSALAAEQYNMMDDTYREVHAEIEDFANTEIFDAKFKDEEPQPAEEKHGAVPEKVGLKEIAEEPQQAPSEPPQAEPVEEPETTPPQQTVPEDLVMDESTMPAWMH